MSDLLAGRDFLDFDFDFYGCGFSCAAETSCLLPAANAITIRIADIERSLDFIVASAWLRALAPARSIISFSSLAQHECVMLNG